MIFVRKRANLNEFENAIMLKRIEKGDFILLLDRFKGRTMFLQLLVSLLIRILKIVGKQVIVSTYHVINRLFLYWTVHITSELSQMLTKFI